MFRETRRSASDVIRVSLVARPVAWLGWREYFDDWEEEGLAFVERLHAQAFIAAVESDVVAVEEDSVDSIRRDTGDAQGFPVGGAHDHDGHYRHPRPESFCSAADGLNNVRPQRGNRPQSACPEKFYADLVIPNDLLQCGCHVVVRVLRKDTAVDGGGCKLGQGGHLVSAFQYRGHTGGTQSRVPSRRTGRHPLP